jgi:hypothetical protein
MPRPCSTDPRERAFGVGGHGGPSRLLGFFEQGLARRGGGAGAIAVPDEPAAATSRPAAAARDAWGRVRLSGRSPTRVPP